MKVISLKDRIDYMIFDSDVNPIKLFVALSSLLYSLTILFGNSVDGIPSLIGLPIFGAAMAIYGCGLIWRIFDTQHRKVTSLLLSIFGSILWVAMAWQEYYEFAYINIRVHDSDVATIASTAIASCWLLIRCGSGEFLTIDKMRK